MLCRSARRDATGERHRPPLRARGGYTVVVSAPERRQASISRGAHRGGGRAAPSVRFRCPRRGRRSKGCSGRSRPRSARSRSSSSTSAATSASTSATMTSRVYRKVLGDDWPSQAGFPDGARGGQGDGAARTGHDDLRSTLTASFARRPRLLRLRADGKHAVRCAGAYPWRENSGRRTSMSRTSSSTAPSTPNGSRANLHRSLQCRPRRDPQSRRHRRDLLSSSTARSAAPGPWRWTCRRGRRAGAANGAERVGSIYR